MRTELLPHQVPAVRQLEKLRVGALFWDPGVGKTRTLIELAQRRQERLSRVVWFAPCGARLTIRHEWLKHTDLPPGQIAVMDERSRPGDHRDAAVVIVGAESLSGSSRIALAAYELMDERTLIAFDESDLFRNVQALRSQRAELFARRAGHRFLLSGTPANEGLGDLYGQMRLLDPAILGASSWYQFQQRHLVYDPERPERVLEERDAELLTARMAPYVSRVEKSQLAELGKKLYDSQLFALTEAQWAAYQQAKEELLPLDGELKLFDIRKLFSALQSIAAGYWNRRDPQTGRVAHLRFPCDRPALLLSTLARLPAGERAVVWCKYAHSVEEVCALLRAAHGEAAVVEYHGGVPEREREGQLQRFQQGQARYLVGTPGTGGRGLNELAGASYAVFYESSYKARERVQAEDRLHRLTTRTPVTLIDLVADCPIELNIQQALSRKEDASRLLLRQLQAARREGGPEAVREALGTV